MDRLIINLDGNSEDIKYFKEYLLTRYDDISIRDMNYSGQEISGPLLVTLLILTAIGGGAGIKAIYETISSIAKKKHDKTVRINEDGEFVIENMSVQEFIKLYDDLNKKNSRENIV